MSLGKRDIPKTVGSIRVANTRVVDIKEDALYSLRSLVVLEFMDIKQLQLRKNALHLPENSNLRVVHMMNTHHIDIRPSALSGSWDHETTIRIQDVALLDIEQNAFNFVSSSLGPILILEEIEQLKLAPSALNAPLRRLTMTNIKMNACHAPSFPANIYELDMKQVRIDYVYQTCVAVSDTLTVRSCQFGVIYPLGISGKADDVEILDSSFNIVHGKGFNIQVNRLDIFGSGFGTLMTGALNVKAESSVLLQNISVESLNMHALRDIQVIDDATGSAPCAFEISKFNIKDAEYGSLALATPSAVYIDGIEVHSSSNPTSSPKEFAKWLIGKTSDDDLTTADEQILEQLEDRPPRPPPEHTHTITGANDSEREKLPMEPTEDNTAHGSKSDPSSDGISTGDTSQEQLDKDDAEDTPGKSPSPPKDGEHGASADNTSAQDIPQDTSDAEIDSGTIITNTHRSETEADASNPDDQKEDTSGGVPGSGGSRLDPWIPVAIALVVN